MKRRYTHLFYYLAPLALTALSACVKTTELPRQTTGGKRLKPCLNIVNGVKTDQWPEVALLAKLDNQERIASTCSGTFVSDSTLITAAHCVEDSVSGGAIYFKGHHFDLTSPAAQTALVNQGVRSLKLITNSRDISRSTSTTNSAAESARDIAILIFPAGTSSTWLTVRDQAFQYGEDVTVVGFGLTEVPDGEAAGTGVFDRRVGSNKVFEPPEFYKTDLKGLISIVGRAKTAGPPQGDAISSSGDSGGPLLSGRQLIGVLSSGYLRSQLGQFRDLTKGAEAGADYADLHSDASLALLRQAKEQGAVFADPPQIKPTTGHSSDAKDRDDARDADNSDKQADDDCVTE